MNKIKCHTGVPSVNPKGTGGNPETFGIASDKLGIGSTKDIVMPQHIIREFARFIVLSPRKKRKEFKPVDYAEQVISSVRSYYEDGTERG